MTAIAFTVPGEPRGKGRPRFSRSKGGAVITFTDAKTASYENLVALAAHNAMGRRPPLECPVTVDLRIRLVPPKALSKTKRAEALAGLAPVLGRFDIDNQAKAVLDGINKIVVVDDRQIARLTVEKVAAETPGVDVVIRPWAPEIGR